MMSQDTQAEESFPGFSVLPSATVEPWSIDHPSSSSGTQVPGEGKAFITCEYAMNVALLSVSRMV
jgi:hypothetical protein